MVTSGTDVDTDHRRCDANRSDASGTALVRVVRVWRALASSNTCSIEWAMSSPTANTQPPSAAGERSADEVLELASEALRARRLAEVAEIRLAIDWAVLHGHPRDGRDPMATPGGDGTPSLREHAIPELAMARETHPASTRALIADGLDLVHRLPLTWAIVEAGDCEPWVARKVAVLTRSLLTEQIGRVDKAVAKAISGHAPSTVLEITRAKIIEADPETHRAEQQRSRHERYVSLSRSDEHGYRHVIARVTAGDAAWIDAMVDRIADILLTLKGTDHNRDELRSEALGWLARPTDVLRLLLEHTQIDDGEDEADCERPAWAPDHLADTIDELTTMPARRLAALRGRGRLFVHLTDETLRTGTGVARIEGVGPIDVSQLHEVLGHADVTVTPVLDLRLRRRVDAYEHPEVIKDHAWLQVRRRLLPLHPPHRHPRPRRLRPRHPLRPHRTTRADRPPQRRPAAPTQPQHQDPQRRHHPRRRPRPTPLAHTPQPRLPRRPHRHPPHPTRARDRDDCRDRGRRRALLRRAGGVRAELRWTGSRMHDARRPPRGQLLLERPLMPRCGWHRFQSIRSARNVAPVGQKCRGRPTRVEF